MKEAEERGMEHDKYESAVAIPRNLITSGFSIDMVSKNTGLSEEFVKTSLIQIKQTMTLKWLIFNLIC